MMKTDFSDKHNAGELLDSLLSHVPIGILWIDETGQITLSNRLARVLLKLGASNTSISGRCILNYVDQIPVLHDKFTRYLEKKGKSFNIDLLKINDRSLAIKGVSTGNGLICIIHDISRLSEMEVESIQSIIAGQENERRRIAREIHDGIGPMLSYVTLELDAYLDEYREQQAEVSEQKLQNIRKTLDSITSDLRDLSHNIIPRLLEDFGLYSAYSNLVSGINNSAKPKLEFFCNFDSDTRFDRDMELNLFRCGQELISNAVRHANASEIHVQMIKHEKSIILMVEDDGTGFDRNENNPHHFGIGLTNIETRVRTLNGVFILESMKNKGTSASIEIPL